MQVIPSVNAPDLATAGERIAAAEKFLPQNGWLHLDVWEKSWNSPEEFKSLKTRLPVEVHLMVADTEKVIDDWLKAGASRLIVHLEQIKNLEAIVAKAKMRGVETMLAINPETPVEKLLEYPQIKYFQILAVTPGLSGQKFQQSALEKIKALRQDRPEALIEIDGGITPETAKLARESGADLIVSASYIFNNQLLTPLEAYQKLITFSPISQ